MSLSGDALRALLDGQGGGVGWSAGTEQITVNVVSWPAGGGVEAHVNPAVDVLIVVLSGSGMLTIDHEVLALEPGATALVPRGSRRSIRADGALAYVSAHVARRPLQPDQLEQR